MKKEVNAYYHLKNMLTFQFSLCYYDSPDVILCGWLGLKHQLTEIKLCYYEEPDCWVAPQMRSDECDAFSDYSVLCSG